MNHTNLFHFFKKGLPLFSLLSLALILWNCNPISSKPSELIDWIPQNSSWVIQINDANTLTSELTNNEVFKEIKLLNKRLTADISNLLSGAPDVESLLCVTKVGKNPGALTHIYKAPLDSTLMNGPSIEYSKVQINIEKRETNVLYSTNIEGYTLRSSSQLLIENCIRTSQQKSTSNSSELFKTIYATLDTNAPTSILVQPKVEELIETMIGQTPLMPKVSHDWNAYDLSFEESGFSLDGLVAIQDSLGDPLGILKENEAHKILLDQLTPASSSALLSIPLNNVLETEDAFKQWVLHHNIPLAQINLKALSTVDEIGWVQLASERVLLFHSQNETQAQGQLLPKLENAKRYREVAYYPATLPDDLLVFAEAIGGKIIPNWGAVIETLLFLQQVKKPSKPLLVAIKMEAR